MRVTKSELTIDFEFDLGNISRGSFAKIDPPLSLLSRPKVWIEAANLFSKTHYLTPDGEAEVTIDWKDTPASACVESALGFTMYMRLLSVEQIMKESKRNKLRYGQPKLDCSVLLRSSVDGEAPRNIATYVVEQFLHDLFLYMNLAAPGSCDLAGSKFRAKGAEYDDEINLMSWRLESCWNHSLDNGWPKIVYVPLKDVLNWKKSLGIGCRQIANNRTERALFALLHVCKNDRYDPPTLLWLSHALEALFDTPVTLIGTFLQKRIIDFLEVPVAKQKQVKRQCRDFYDLRSSFAHGDLAIAHPFENEILDPSVQTYRPTLGKSIDFATSVCLSTLQKLIVNRWQEVTFTESYEGVPLKT